MTRSGNTKGNTKLTKLTTVDHDTRLQVLRKRAIESVL